MQIYGLHRITYKVCISSTFDISLDLVSKNKQTLYWLCYYSYACF